MRWSVAALVTVLLAPAAQVAIDSSLQAAVERFYAMQESEDIAGYAALWARTAQDPQRLAQLAFIFNSGDDKFSNLSITSVRSLGEQTVVRVSVTRDRTSTSRRPDGSAFVFHTEMRAALTYIREGTDWKLVREGSPVDALADALIAAPGAAEREQLLAAEPDLVGPGLVTAFSRQADAFAQRGMFSNAQALYERALELAIRIGHKKLQSETLQNLGNALYYQRSFAAATPIYEQRLAIERELGDLGGMASALVGLGTAQYSQFEYTDALAAFHEALALQEKLSDGPGMATTLISTGNVQFVEGDYAGAIADYRRSRALYRAASDTLGEARALDGLGRSFAAQGDLAAALEAFGGVLEEARSRNDAGLQGTALSSIGEVHFRLGNLESARGFFDRSRAEFETTRDSPNAGRAWQGMAMADLVSARFAIAEEEYGRSAAACASGQDPDCVARATVGLAYAQAAQEHYDAAITTYRKAISAFTSLKKREDAARAEIGLSQALAGARDYAGALVPARHARDEGAAFDRPDVVWRALVAQARALRKMSSPVPALAAAKDAVAEVERMTLAALDRPNEAVPGDAAGAYALLAVLQAEAGDTTGAFTTVEKRRAQLLRAGLAVNERDIARGMTPAERDDERQLAARVVSLRALFDHERTLPKPDTTRLARMQKDLAAAVESRRAQRERVFARLPDLRMWRGLNPVAPDLAAGSIMKDGELLVEFVIDDDALLAVSLARRPEGTERRALITTIARRALAELVARAVDPAALRSVDAWRVASADLLKALPVGLWAAMTDAPEVILVPDDVLWRVPFEALPAGTGFLADRTSVTYTDSAASLISARTPGAAEPTATLLAVAAPELSASRRDGMNSSSPGWSPRVSEAAEAETRTVVSAFAEPAATLLTGAAATEDAFRTQAASATLLHVAAPFRMNGASPLFSSIFLSAADTGDAPAENDGVLEARELMNLDLRARAVVLSDGASMSMRDAAPAAGTIRWAWRAAGVPSVVLSRWDTDGSAAAAHLMTELIGRLKGGEAAGRALDGARRAVRSAEETRAPYFWAGWMVIGR